MTEYGVANLRAKSLRERARLLINIAHPKFRDQLWEATTNAMARRISNMSEKKIGAVNGHTLQKVFLSVEDHIAVMTLHNPPVNAADGVVTGGDPAPVRLYQP